MNELKGRKEAIKDQKLIKREALTDGTIETLLDGRMRSNHPLTSINSDLFRFEKSAVFAC